MPKKPLRECSLGREILNICENLVAKRPFRFFISPLYVQHNHAALIFRNIKNRNEPLIGFRCTRKTEFQKKGCTQEKQVMHCVVCAQLNVQY